MDRYVGEAAGHFVMQIEVRGPAGTRMHSGASEIGKTIEFVGPYSRCVHALGTPERSTNVKPHAKSRGLHGAEIRTRGARDLPVGRATCALGGLATLPGSAETLKPGIESR